MDHSARGQLRTRRSFPDRRVTRSRSRYSSSGIVYLRLSPVRSLNAPTSRRDPGRPPFPHLRLERVERGRVHQPLPDAPQGALREQDLADAVEHGPRRAGGARDLVHVDARQARRAGRFDHGRARAHLVGREADLVTRQGHAVPRHPGGALGDQVRPARARTRLRAPGRRRGAAALREASPPSTGSRRGTARARPARRRPGLKAPAARGTRRARSRAAPRRSPRGARRRPSWRS